MNENEILDVLKNLSKNQGFYYTLYAKVLEEPELLKHLVNINFKDTIDLILYLEQ